MSTDNCLYGQRETTKHLLLDCKLYKRERKDLLVRIKKEISVIHLTLPLIIYTKIGITNLLVFLKDTNICTRKWYLEREVQEVEEEEEEENRV